MIDRSHALPLTRQAGVLKPSRRQRLLPASTGVTGGTRRSCGGSTSCISITRSRAAGCCAICWRGEGVEIGRQRVATMMRRMGIEAIYRRPNPSKATPGNKTYPYLLRGLTAYRPARAQVWGDAHHLHPHGARLARSTGHSSWVLDGFSPRGSMAGLDRQSGGGLLPRGRGVRCDLVRTGTPDIFNN